MGLFLRFFSCPHPRCRGADVADDRLPALGDMDVRPEMNWLWFLKSDTLRSYSRRSRRCVGWPLRPQVVAARQSGRRLRIHCVDATKEPPLIRRDFDQFGVLFFGRRAHFRWIEGGVGEFASDCGFRLKHMSADDE